MKKHDEKRIAAKLAKTMALLCVRNTHLETVHAGKTPITRTGDWSDVTVVDADGKQIPWTEVSHVSDHEMRNLMRDIINRIYTFHLCANDPRLQAEIDRWMAVAETRDEPELDRRMIHGNHGTSPKTPFNCSNVIEKKIRAIGVVMAASRKHSVDVYLGDFN